MAHPSQHLLRCVYVVHQGNVEVVEVSILLVCWAPIMEMFVEASVCFLSSDCTLCGTPSVANIAATSFSCICGAQLHSSRLPSHRVQVHGVPCDAEHVCAGEPV